jgi:hypothetical protein
VFTNSEEVQTASLSLIIAEQRWMLAAVAYHRAGQGSALGTRTRFALDIHLAGCGRT